MGYFSNSSEGMDYEARYCQRCVHERPDDGGCAVWLAHMLHNYGSAEVQEVLDILIPREGIGNAQCRMFLRRPAAVS